jgi:CheY-like chemotaxis protein
MILQAADRATSLTRQLLAFSRRQILELSVFNLDETLDRMVPMMRRLIGEDIDILVKVPPRSCCRVKADGGQIEQVILNLAVNARDAMPAGGKLTFELAEVTLDESYAKRRPDARPGDYVMLAVSDTGSGIDAGTIEHIFEPFFTTKSKDKGTGLGLATVYGIVKQCGGHVAVYSEPGRGTTFKVYLPRVFEETAKDGRERLPDVPSSGSETVLVVEDDEAVRMLIFEVLSRRGYKTLMAATPGEALRIYQAHAKEGIDLLLTDVVMPEMSGRELANQIAQLNPGVRVLFMSGYTDAAIVHHGVLDEGTAFIHKPFTPDSLSRKLRDVMGTRQQQ